MPDRDPAAARLAALGAARLGEHLAALWQVRAMRDALAAEPSVETVLARGVTETLAVCDAPRAFIAVVENDHLVGPGGPVADPACEALRRRLRARPVPLRVDTMEWRVLRRSTTERSGDSDLSEQAGLRHPVMAPIPGGGGPVAVLVADWPDAPDELAADLVEALAMMVGGALERVVGRLRLQELATEFRSMTLSASALVQEVLAAPMTLPSQSGGPGVAGFPHRDPLGPAGGALADALSGREIDIAALLARGDSNRKIAEQLHLSPETVKTYVGRILRKLGAANRVEASARILQMIRD